jgi:N-acetylmuramate 1-kinase
MATERLRRMKIIHDTLRRRPIAWPDAQRRDAFHRWFETVAPRHALQPATLEPASADASFRRYLRVRAGDGSA